MTADKPRAGIRVVEMSHMVMWPPTGMFPGFFGAGAIKLEPPEGDKTRDFSGMGAGFFPTFNRGNKSLALDLKTEQGLSALKARLATADVFVEDFRDEALAKLTLATDLTAAGATATEATTEMRCGHQLPPAHAVAQVIDRWAEEVATLSRGKIDVQILGADRLVGAGENISATAKGDIECPFSVQFQWGKTLPIMSVTTAPFAFPT